MFTLVLFYITLSFLLTTILHHKLRHTIHTTPPTYAVIGCLIAFYNNRHRLLSWYTDLLSSSPTQTIVIQRLGAPKTIITANPQNVEHMLKTNFLNFPKGKPFTDILNDFLGFGIFNVDGELWHAQRKLASHQFTSRLLKEHMEVNVKEAVKFKLLPLLDSFCLNVKQTTTCQVPNHITKHDSKTNTVVDLQEVLRRLGFDIVCKLTLGFDPNCLVDHQHCFSDKVPILKAFDTAGEISAKRAALPIAAVWKLKKMLRVGSEKVLRESVNEVHEYVMEIIHERKKNIIINKVYQNQDLLSKLIMEGVCEELIRDMMISFIMAGRDTTSAAMTWLFYALSKNSHVEENLVNEICSKFKDDEFDDFKEMKYLQACLCETMRLYPPVSWDSKHALNDDVLPDGTPVQAGDRVTYFPYGMGRMESIWGPDRLEFKPDRWLDIKPGESGGLKEVSAYKYPVFHAGPRVCLGKGMANVQMSYVVGSMVKRFEIRQVGSGEGVYVPSLTAQMDGGFKVVVRRRPE
ncbi:putative cytochrome P450 [Helianthus annuus]|nr:putative cytochrome P450 [Helianthus annuus]